MNLPLWLSVPVEQGSLTEREAELLLWLWVKKPPVLLDDEMALINKLDLWVQLSKIDIQGVTPH